MGVFVLVDVAVALGFVAVPTHHGSFQLCAPWVDHERWVTVDLTHEKLIDRADACRGVVGLGWDDFKPLGLDDVNRTALVSLGTLYPCGVNDDEHGRTGEAFVQQGLEHGSHEALHAHVEAHTLVKYQCASSGVLLSEHCCWRKAQVHADHHRANAVKYGTQPFFTHVVIWPEVFVHGHTRA